MIAIWGRKRKQLSLIFKRGAVEGVRIDTAHHKVLEGEKIAFRVTQSISGEFLVKMHTVVSPFLIPL